MSFFGSPFPPSDMNRDGRVEPTPPECALAAEMFDTFCSAGTMKQILALHREICNKLTLKPNRLPGFYPKLKVKVLCIPYCNLNLTLKAIRPAKYTNAVLIFV